MLPGDVTAHVGPIATEWLSRVWLPKHPVESTGEGRYREMQTPVMSIGLLLTGKVTQGLDFLMARLKALQKSKLDGNEHVSKFYELIPRTPLVRRSTGRTRSL